MKTKIILIILIVAFTSCQSVKDGLSGRKSENSDEFLVQKKKSTSFTSRLLETTKTR